jgi:hypothetical protein
LLIYEAACSIPSISRSGSIPRQRIPLINPQRGIFKPRQMSHLLSIKTVFPKGRSVWYDDQRQAHRQIYTAMMSSTTPSAI